MLKSVLAASAVVLALGFAGSPGSAQAQTQNCAAAAVRANDNIALRLQQAGLGAENRESAKAHIAMANNAAASGNEAECWRQLQISGLFVATPSNPAAPQTGVAGVGVNSGK
ncbi:MAG TPA: hypothetical protein VMH36_25735 [Alphaproteobacteria bacterium]|nr:hypothetical protein [Alphaproteobacteria bacterium]